MGIAIDELVGKHFTELVADSHKEEVLIFYDRQKLKATPNTYHEFPIHTAPGNILWIGQNVSIYTEGGAPKGIIAVARPITKLKSIESSLSQSEARLKSVIDSALDAVIVINESGRITEWNKQAEHTFGWSREWILGKTLTETIIPSVHREGHEKGMKNFLKTGHGPVLNKRIEIIAQNKRGIIFPVELAIVPNKIDGVYFFSAFVRDITEAKKSERALKAINDLAIGLLGKNTLEEIAWEITQNTIDKFGFEDCIIYIVDQEKGILKQIAAYGPKNPEAEVIAAPIEIEIGKGIVGSVVLSGEAVLLEDTTQDPRYIVDDESRLSELTVPIIADGEVIGIIDSEHSEKGFFTDEHLNSLTTVANLVSTQLKNAIIQERKLIAEKALKESEERWHTLVDNQPEAIQISRNGTVLFLNPAGLHLYGADKPEDIIGKDLFSFSSDQLRPLFDERLRKMERGEKVPALEFDILTFKGEKKTIEATSTMVIYNGETAIQTVARDITDKKRQEARREQLLKELEIANDELSEFAHVVSHDLKAPLRAISSLSEWIVEDYEESLDEGGKSYLNQLVSNVHRMDQLIDGILTYSTSDHTGGLVEAIDSLSYINKVISTLSIPSSTKLDFEGDFPTINYNKVQFQQVVQNLLSNAIKFVDKESGHVHIKCAEDEKYWTFSISDNGDGVPDDVGEGIFNLFSTFHDQPEQSTGIGLSIVKKIVDRNGGRVWYESEPGKGTTFYFTIIKGIQNDERSEINLTS